MGKLVFMSLFHFFISSKEDYRLVVDYTALCKNKNVMLDSILCNGNKLQKLNGGYEYMISPSKDKYRFEFFFQKNNYILCINDSDIGECNFIKMSFMIQKKHTFIKMEDCTSQIRMYSL